MPGLICVLGTHGAAESVRAAAVPLRRRQRHRLDLLEEPSQGVALAFCGEYGGVARDHATGSLAALDGELLLDRSPASGDEAAALLLARCLADGPAFDPPEGWFGAAVWDGTRRTLVLVADRFGQRPLYLARTGETVLVASELKALVAAGLEPRLDLQAWAEMLAFEYPLEGSAPLEGVRLVPAASTLVLGADGEERLRRRWRYRCEPADDADERELVEELARRLERAVLRRLGPRTALGLSAGLDSRSIAGDAARRAPHTLAATYGAPGSEDLLGGTELARRAGLAHRSLPLEPGYISRGAAETVWLGEGHVRCFHAHHLALRRLRGDGFCAVLMGFAGDVVMRGRRLDPPSDEGAFASAIYEEIAGCVPDRLAREVFTDGFAAEIRGRAREALARRLATEEGDGPNRWGQFSFNNNRVRMLWGSELFRDDLLPRDPFHDVELVELCRRMPERLRVGGVLHRAYLARFPELTAVPSPKDGIAPGLTGVRRSLAASATKVRRRARSTLDSRLGYAWRPSRAGLGDYASDLRRTGAGLLGTLLEPRTLRRGQLREEGIRRLIDELLTGRARHTRALGMLLTFELFQRQFLEGERPS